MCWRGALTCTSWRGTSSTYGTGREVASAQVRALRAAATFARVALRVAACFDACKATFAVLLLAIFAAAAEVAAGPEAANAAVIKFPQ